MSSIGTKLRVGVVVAGLALASPAIVGFVSGDDAQGPARAAVVADQRLSPVEAVQFWRDRTRERPADYIGRTHLASSWLRLARESGDGQHYLDAEAAARAALAVNPDHADATVALAAARLSQHDFESAAELAAGVLRTDPEDEAALSVFGDASFELGDIDAARQAYQALAGLGRSAAVTSRLARLAALDSGPARALDLAAEALTDAERSALGPAELYFYRVQLASHHFAVGDLDGAFEQIRAVLDESPDHATASLWEARLLAASGDLDAAVDAYERGLAPSRHPEFVAELADVYELLGRTDEAEALIAEAIDGAGEGALDAEGPLAGTENRHLVHILADHRIDADRAVRLAEAELDIRRDAGGFDALAWALLAAGRVDEAADAIDEALAMGGGPETWYHAGRIAAAQGETAAAEAFLRQALDANPHFDLLHGRMARDLLGL